MGHQRIAERVGKVPPSGIRRFFDIVAQMPDVISLGIGEPDFVTPEHIRQAAMRGLEVGSTAYTAYTSNSGLLELRLALAAHIEQLYGIAYDPEQELLITLPDSGTLCPRHKTRMQLHTEPQHGRRPARLEVVRHPRWRAAART